MSDHGMWSVPGFPHKGWKCDDIYDMSPDFITCEVCQRVSIRYVHVMVHEDWPDKMRAGCICASHMEEDRLAAPTREREFQKTQRTAAREVREAAKEEARRQKRRLEFARKESWKYSQSGNRYIKVDDFVCITYRFGDGYRAIVKDNVHERQVRANKTYTDELQVRMACYDVMNTDLNLNWEPIQ